MTTTAATAADTSTAATAERTPVVSFRQVSKSYGAVRAVCDLDLELSPGETVALLGPNGAGKSSTLDLLLGLRTADSGTVTLFGTTPQRAIEQGRVGAMLQSGGLMEGVKVRNWSSSPAISIPAAIRSTGSWPPPTSPTSPTARSTSSPAARNSGCASPSPPPAPAI